jgi:hypothetical protein
MKPIIVVSDVIRIIIVVKLCSIQNNTNKIYAPDYKALVDGCTSI